MSGSGSSNYSSGSGGSSGEEYDCLKYVERVQLSSPVPAVVSGLAVGDLLDVRLFQTGAVTIIEAIAATGSVAGSLVPSKMAQLLNCLRDGVEYSAHILSIDRGLVRVEIRPKSP